MHVGVDVWLLSPRTMWVTHKTHKCFLHLEWINKVWTKRQDNSGHSKALSSTRAGTLSCSLWWLILICQLHWNRKLLVHELSTFLGVSWVVLEAWSCVLYGPRPFLSGSVPLLCFSAATNYTALFCHILPPWCSCLGTISHELNPPELWAKLNPSSFKFRVLDIAPNNEKED